MHVGESISNQSDIFLTGRHNQDFHSGHYDTTYVQYNFSIIGSLVENISHLQAWPVSQMIFYCTKVIT